MSTQNVNFQVVFADTDFIDCNTFSIINQYTSAINIRNLDTNLFIILNANQSVTLSASTGFVLPPLRVQGFGSFVASVITT
jgi:hypothetical protein